MNNYNDSYTSVIVEMCTWFLETGFVHECVGVCMVHELVHVSYML